MFCFLAVSINISCAQPASSSNESFSSKIQTNYVDLSYAAEKSVHSVVHIKTEFLRKNALWDYFFGK